MTLTCTHAHKACSSVNRVTSSDELWEMVVTFSEVIYKMENSGCGFLLLTLLHISHFRSWKPQQGTKATSIKPPLILIYFVISHELLLIKCVPDCIMGVRQVLCMKLIHHIIVSHYRLGSDFKDRYRWVKAALVRFHNSWTHKGSNLY